MKKSIVANMILITTPIFTLLLTISYQSGYVPFLFLADEIGSQTTLINLWSYISLIIGSITTICLIIRRFLVVRYMLSGLFISIVVLQLPPTVLWLIFSMISKQVELIIPFFYHGIIITLGVMSLKINFSNIQ